MQRKIPAIYRRLLISKRSTQKPRLIHPFLFDMKISRLLTASIVFLLLHFYSFSQIKNDIEVSADARSGEYSVRAASLNWIFRGSVGQPLQDLKSESGTDALGAYKAIRFKWKNNNNYAARIRWYAQQPVVLFDLILPEGAQESPVAFPEFTSIPELPFRFSYHNHIFALPQFLLEETSTPWMLYNDHAQACVISPASDFMVSLMTHKDSATISSGLNPEVKKLPAGFTHSTLMVLDKGIRNTWDGWGKALRTLYGRKRPGNDADVLLKYFGYWTDNGGDYYYNYDTAKGYAGTLLAVRQYYKEQGIPLGYMQLDSWWYKKTRNNVYGKEGAAVKKPQFPAGAWNRSGGLLEYKADSFLFPEGLAEFQHKLGLPLVTHNRWIDSASPYQQRFKISHAAAIDPAFWDEIMAYLKKSGVKVYEQDWMNYMYRLNPAMASDINIGNAFTGGMAKAAQKNGIDLQYCMALPRYFMQGLKYNNLTSIRPSGDRFMSKRWMNFIFTSQLAYETGIWPWCDVFKSSETGNMIVAVLSAGAVGTGDAIGKEDKANILMACRPDGVLVKPDVPLLPMDADYVQLARGEYKPLLASTYTRHGDITTNYVFAFADTNTTINRYSFRPADIGIKNRVLIYDPQRNTAQLLDAAQTFQAELPEEKYAYYILAPLTSSGIAFLGDTGKIAATGKKRIANILSSGKNLQVKVLFARGEGTVVLKGYSEKKITTDRGVLTKDPSNHLFTLTIRAPKNGNMLTVNLTGR